MFLKIDRFQKLLSIYKDKDFFKAKLQGCQYDSYHTVKALSNQIEIPATVIDVGAAAGQLVKCFYFFFPESYIVAIEPISFFYKNLLKLKQKISNFECHNCAIGMIEGEKDFFINEFKYSSSILQLNTPHLDNYPFASKVEKSSAHIIKLSNLLNIKNYARPILLKIDVQGYELEVLKSVEKNLREIDYILCETSFFEMYKKQPLFNDVYKYLNSHEFVFMGNIGQKYSNSTGKILQADSLFINREKNC